jgi:hypothetical protein
MSNIHKISAINEMKSLVNEFPDYSLGEVLYSFLNIAAHENGQGRISDILNLTDEQILSAIETAKTKETAETEYFTT